MPADDAPADSVRAAAPAPQASVDQEELKRTLDQIGRAQVEGRREWERRKNPRTALLSSMILPGLGQVYNGRRLKVVVMVGIMSFYTGNVVINWRAHKQYEAQRELLPEGSDGWDLYDRLSLFHEETAIDFMWWAGATWLIGILDAWIDAHLFDIRAYSPETKGKGKAAPKSSSQLGLRAERDGKRYLTLTVDF